MYRLLCPIRFPLLLEKGGNQETKDTKSCGHRLISLRTPVLHGNKPYFTCVDLMNAALSLVCMSYLMP